MINQCEILKHLGSGKSGDSYLILCDGTYYVYKKMHHKPFINGHTFTIEDELNSYHILKQFSLNIPKLIYYDLKASYLIKSYIEGVTLAEFITKNPYPLALYQQTYATFKHIEKKGFNIDYFPTNFIISNNKLYYIDYEINPYQPTWSFLSWGIHYWFNRRGFIRYLKDHSQDHILLNHHDGIPIKMHHKKVYQIFMSMIHTEKGEQIT